MSAADPELDLRLQTVLPRELPAGATEFSMPLGLVPEGVERSGRDFRFWGPLYPGEQEISFRYEVPIEVGAQTLAKRFQDLGVIGLLQCKQTLDSHLGRRVGE